MVKIQDNLKERMLAKEKSDRNFLLWVALVMSFITVIIFLNSFVLFFVKVDGVSMVPTLSNEDVLVANKLKTPERGDIIIIDGEKYNSTTGKYELLIKRVIATEGEVVEIKDGYVYIDNLLLDEPYLDRQGITESMGITRWELSEGEIFYLGDNRLNSNDSRYQPFGTCNVSQIKGVVTKWSLKARGINGVIHKISEFLSEVKG